MWLLALVATAGVVAVATPAQATGVPARQACASTNASSTYTVVNGDGWFSVASAAGVTMRSLLRANDAAASAALYPGDVLCLPSGATTPAPASNTPACTAKHAVMAGDSWSGIAASQGLRTSELLHANKATSATVLHPGDELCLPASATPAAPADPCVSKRTVAAGESWYVIARSTGVPTDALYAANHASAASTLHPGQNLCLPAVGFGRGLRNTLLAAAPVRGPCRFANSWKATRGGGRLHVGVDLISPTGTPVIATADGTLSKQTKGAARSGNAWWLTTATGTYFFYAHLSGFAKGLSVGSHVRAGDVIGYVGSTGNAVSPHLHFEIHPHGGGPINPYASIWMIGGCVYDRRYEQAPLS